MMKRKILLILLAALFLVSLFGCAPSPSGQTPAPMVELQTVPPAPETIFSTAGIWSSS